MHAQLYRYLLISLLSITILGSCARREDVDTSVSEDSVSSTTNSTGPMTGDSTNMHTGTTTPVMTDANILAMMAMSDSMEIAAGTLAKSKAKDAKVKKFAQKMVTEHGKMKKEGEALAKKASLTPQLPSPMPAGMQSHMMGHMDTLNTATGADFDSKYMHGQVMMHEMVLQHLNTFNPQDTTLRGHIDKAKQHVQQHLEEAKSIHDGLGGSAGHTH